MLLYRNFVHAVFYVKKAMYAQCCEFDSLDRFQSNQSLETLKYETQKFRRLIFTKIPLQKNFIRWFFFARNVAYITEKR